MSRYRKILAYCFLLIFGVFGVHQLTPHHHHAPGDSKTHIEHQVAEQTHSHDHGGDHHHHHNNEHEQESEEGGLGCLLHNHTHTGETIDFTIVTSTQKHDLQFEWFADDFLSQLQYPSAFQLLLEERSLDRPPPPIIQHAFLATSYLRGPPPVG